MRLVVEIGVLLVGVLIIRAYLGSMFGPLIIGKLHVGLGFRGLRWIEGCWTVVGRPTRASSPK